MNKSFNRIRDTRQQSQVRHDLNEIIAMTITAVTGNCDGRDEIEDFCQSKEKWLYVLSLSENQLTLHEYAETCFKDALEHPQWYPEMTSYETVDKEHGKIEKRTYYLSSDLSGLENAADWSGLSGFGMVRSQVTVGEVESSEIRYAITSLKSVEQFAHAWRKHWRIENGLHSLFGLSFNENHSRIRTDHAPENLAVVRYFALSALKQLPEPRRASIKRKRKICAYELEFLSFAVD